MTVRSPFTSPLVVVCWVTVGVTLVDLAWSLRIEAGDPLFYPATISLAVVLLLGAAAARWVSRGSHAPADALIAEPAPAPSATSRGHDRTRWDALDRRVTAWGGHPLPLGLAAGVAMLLLFLVGAAGVAQVPMLREPVQDLLDHARLGSLPVVLVITAVNGVAEELFYRGALYDAYLRRRPLLVTSIVYTAVTAASGIPLLALAALLLGIACAVLRRATRGLVAPIACHLVWSIGMLLLLPPTLDLLETLR